MIRLQGTVEYEGGRVEHWQAGSAALAEWELYAQRHGIADPYSGAHRVLSTLVVAWAALGVEEGFDVWRKSVMDVDADAAAETALPPTVPAPSAG